MAVVNWLCDGYQRDACWLPDAFFYLGLVTTAFTIFNLALWV
ncbi:hypothetical protein ACLK1T_25420 [Escherichia coli]